MELRDKLTDIDRRASEAGSDVEELYRTLGMGVGIDSQYMPARLKSLASDKIALAQALRDEHRTTFRAGRKPLF